MPIVDVQVVLFDHIMHELSDIETIFCIHRDRRYNSKALDISLDGQNLINYTAAGVTSQGTSFWAGAPDLQ